MKFGEEFIGQGEFEKFGEFGGGILPGFEFC